MSASVKITGLGNVRKSVDNLFHRVKKNPALLLEIGEALQADVVNNARAGRSADKEAFRSLSDSWQKTREYLKKFNAIGEFYIGGSSANLTFTGEFLKSIRYRINPSEGLAIVEPTGTHPGYKTKNGNTKKLSNLTLSKYLKELGFEFLFVSKAFQKRTSVIVRRFLRREILKNK
jgi:hypothetical protein